MLRLACAQVLALNGRENEAIVMLDALPVDASDNFFFQLGRFYGQSLRRNRDAALVCVSDELKTAASSDLNYAWIMSQGYALIDEKQQALQWLSVAVERGFINFPLLSHLDPFLENIRKEPEFASLMESTRERWEAFEV